MKPYQFSSSKNMIAAAVVFAIFWALVLSETPGGSETSLEKRKRSTPRGYYGGYPYVPFSEPLTILAGLAFIAYIIQTFNAIYHNHGLGGGGGLLGGGGGGLLGSVLPGKGREEVQRPERSEILNMVD